MEQERVHLLEVAPEALASWLDKQGEPAYRLGQIMEWVYARRVGSFEEMTNLPGSLRTRLAETYTLDGLREIERTCSEDGGTGKLLLELDDREQIECVWMDDGARHTFCISSQAGCALGCQFCATGAAGFGRNLTLREILGQVVELTRTIGDPHNIVFMGMGEPLLNLDVVLPALESLTAPDRFGLSPRRITVSTAGVAPGIRRLAAAPVHPNLALSLNSAFDDQRTKLMPVNARYPLADVLDACEEYGRGTGRSVTLEYVLLGGVNTSEEDARAVARIAHRLHALVNLIPFNTVHGCGLHPPGPDEVDLFRSHLEQRQVHVTQRYRRGRDIAAACGQLRGKHPARET